MRFFDKENFDLLTTSPGNYIFKNKSNKSEFGKLTSILHILFSIIILIYYLYSYNKGTGMNVIYSKKTIETFERNENDDYKNYTDKIKDYEIYIGCNNENITGSEIQKNIDIKIIDNNSEEIDNTIKIDEEDRLNINFSTSNPFNIIITNKSEILDYDFFFIQMLYKTSLMNNEEKIPMKENEIQYSESFVANVNKYNVYFLNKNVIIYRDGIRLKKFKSYLKFWTHDETNYIDLTFNSYFSTVVEKNEKRKNMIVLISYASIQNIKYYDFYQRNYESFFTVLSKWCGVFSTLKILFSSLVLNFSYSFNNYELIKYINKKYDSNKILLNNNNNNNNDNKENKNIELNKINVDKIKQFNKIKNSDIFKYSFLGCCYSKSKTHNIIKECDKYVAKHISIEEIFYNMLLFENFIEDYKFKDNNNLKKFEEIKNKIDLYEKEMKLIDENDTSNKNINNININLIDKTSNFSSINES